MGKDIVNSGRVTIIYQYFKTFEKEKVSTIKGNQMAKSSNHKGIKFNFKSGKQITRIKTFRKYREAAMTYGMSGSRKEHLLF
ncbi:protein transport protein Sec61 subunit alpha-like protein [Corchorus olitorius]|uniref:Protein transport protein Sec61 subunit alpha-like protein n=1 Tax=Corchorus olitorius TaxID=93759 RepID=A0A1R3H018_9ROSI|nr:protein transport protein Sec61 subunit alpha-like protein [Corchorus olitorius]